MEPNKKENQEPEFNEAFEKLQVVKDIKKLLRKIDILISQKGTTHPHQHENKEQIIRRDLITKMVHTSLPDISELNAPNHLKIYFKSDGEHTGITMEICKPPFKSKKIKI